MSKKPKKTNLRGQVLRKANNNFRRRVANGRKKFAEELQDHLAQKALAENKRKRAYKASVTKNDSSFIRRVKDAIRGFLDRVSTFFQQF